MVKDSVELGLQTEAEIIRHHQEILRAVLAEVMWCECPFKKVVL